MRSLKDTLLQDVNTLGVCTFNTQLVFKNYSKTLYACYRAKTDKVYLYLYSDQGNTSVYSYRHYLVQTLHEFVHGLQYHDPNWTRMKGVMHDRQFWKELDGLLSDAENKDLFNKEVIVKDGKFFTC